MGGRMNDFNLSQFSMESLTGDSTDSALRTYPNVHVPNCFPPKHDAVKMYEQELIDKCIDTEDEL